MAAVGIGVTACDAKLDKPKSSMAQEVVELIVGGKTFAVPVEHLASLQSNSQTFTSEHKSENVFLAHFSAAWLSARVDGYQPIINNGFQGSIANISVGEQVIRDSARASPVFMDLWYKRGAYNNRVITDKKEPNTGLHIIQPIPYKPSSDHDHEQWFLAKILPNQKLPYPEKTQWRPYICRRTNGIIRGAKVYTKCSLNKKAADDIFFYIFLSSENLTVRESVLSVLASEINSWIIDRKATNDR